ncbi:MAG: hypothetical protein JW723_11350 [Bacteroidales bacterium]|nr:hypothetical protein [Bacteroidales bacterium]
MSRIKIPILICSVIILAGCEDLFVNQAESNLNMEDFEAAWNRVDAVYPYLDYKQIDWDSIYVIYKPRALNAKGDEIYTVLFEMLGELKDRHIYVKTLGGNAINTFQPPRWLKDKDAYDPVVVRDYFDEALFVTGEGRIEYGIIPGNIGYIYMATFDGDYLLNCFPEALNFVKNTKGLILDIRHNNGGSYQNLVAVVSRFITSPLAKPDYYVLGEIIPLPPFEPQGYFQYVNPVIVLINGVCYSTGDIFPEVMKQISTVTLVGDTTGGGSSGSTSSAPAEYTLPSGKKIFVGTTDWRRYDGLPYEWIGVPPDILVQQSKEDIESGRDRQLEYAINMFKE